METQRSPLFNWHYYYQFNNYHGKSMEELKNALICTTLELETTRLAAQEEIRKREEQLTNVQESLNKAIIERNEAQAKSMLLEKLLLQQQQQQKHQQKVVVNSGSSSSNIEDETTINTNKLINNNVGNNLSSSDCEESIISSLRSPSSLPQPQPQPLLTALPESAMKLLPTKEELPEKGNLLQAVIKAGPLLQTLLLAGPLPQWRHPPPPLENFDIPPVTMPAAAAATTSTVNNHNHNHNQSEVIGNHHDYHQDEALINGTNTDGFDDCGIVNRKRGFCYDDEFSCEANKYQRVLLH